MRSARQLSLDTNLPGVRGVYVSRDDLRLGRRFHNISPEYVNTNDALGFYTSLTASVIPSREQLKTVENIKKGVKTGPDKKMKIVYTVEEQLRAILAPFDAMAEQSFESESDSGSDSESDSESDSGSDSGNGNDGEEKREGVDDSVEKNIGHLNTTTGQFLCPEIVTILKQLWDTKQAKALKKAGRDTIKATVDADRIMNDLTNFEKFIQCFPTSSTNIEGADEISLKTTFKNAGLNSKELKSLAVRHLGAKGTSVKKVGDLYKYIITLLGVANILTVLRGTHAMRGSLPTPSWA